MHPADAVYHDRTRKDRRSKLKKVLDSTDLADYQNVVACPFGCTGADQDRLGYCKHLIGFCEDRAGTLAEGEVKKVSREDPVVVELVSETPDKDHLRRTMTGKKDVLRIGDHLRRITSSLRVYRDAAKTPKA